MNTNSKLKEQQIRFCQEYLIDYNATNAALRAGYKPASAASRGSRFLKDPEVKAYIDELQAERMKNNMATFEKVKHELSLLAFSDISDFMDFKNDISDLRYVDQTKKRAISSIHISKTQNKSGSHEHTYIKMHDKLDALKVLAKHMGFFKKEEGKDAEDYVKQIIINPIGPFEEHPDFKKYFPNGFPPEPVNGEVTDRSENVIGDIEPERSDENGEDML